MINNLFHSSLVTPLIESTREYFQKPPSIHAMTKSRLNSVLRTVAFLTIGSYSLGFAGNSFASNSGDPLTPRIEATRDILFAPQPRVAVATDGSFALSWQIFPRRFFRRYQASGVLAADTTPLDGVYDGASPASSQPVATRRGLGSAVVYLADAPGSLDSRIVVQRFADDGTQLGGLIEVARSSTRGPGPLEFAADAGNQAIAMRPDGGFVVAWRVHRFSGISSTLSTGRSDDIYVRRYDRVGQPEGPEQLIVTRVARPLEAGIQIVINDQGDYAVVYQQSSLSRPLEFPYFAHVFRAGSVGRGVPIHFTNPGEPQQVFSGESISACFLNTGELVLGWRTTNDRFKPTEERLLVRRYSLLGAPRGPIIEVAKRWPGSSSDYGMSLSALPSGGFAATWSSFEKPTGAYPYPTTGKGYGQYFAANDVPLGEPFLIDEDAFQLDAGTDARGNLVATFSPQKGPVYARVFQGP